MLHLSLLLHDLYSGKFTNTWSQSSILIFLFRTQKKGNPHVREPRTLNGLVIPEDLKVTNAVPPEVSLPILHCG